MNDGIDVMFHENVDLEARDSQTDKNMAGIPDRMGRFPINKEDSCPEIFGIK